MHFRGSLMTDDRCPWDVLSLSLSNPIQPLSLVGSTYMHNRAARLRTQERLRDLKYIPAREYDVDIDVIDGKLGEIVSGFRYSARRPGYSFGGGN
jgi:hypothetical protein